MTLDLRSPVASLLKARNVTVRELAEKVGISTQTLHYHITQGDRVKLSQLGKFAKACGAKIVLRLDGGKKKS